MRVLFLFDTLQVGGAEKSLYEISIRLKTVNPIFCTLFSKKPDLVDRFKSKGIEVYTLDLNYNSKFWLIEGFLRYRRLIKILQPNCIHAHLFNSELLSRLATPLNIPIIGSFVNDSYSHERFRSNTLIQNIKLNFIKSIDKFTARRVTYFTSITKTIANNNSSNLAISKEKITVIPRGRDIKQFSPSTKARNETEIFIFLVVARLLLRKGYFDLINAVASLAKEECRNFKLIIAGDGPDKQTIKAYVEEMGVSQIIEFKGTVNNVTELLNQSDCFIMASHYEGQGGALVEAMLCAKPIIASDIPVFREQLDNNGSAIFFKVKDFLSLAFSMKLMMRDREKAKEMGLMARKIAEIKYDIENIAEQYDKFYLSVFDEDTSVNSKKATPRC